MPHHQPPTTRSEARAETGGILIKRISGAVSDSCTNVDNLLISDAPSFERTPKCQ